MTAGWYLSKGQEEETALAFTVVAAHKNIMALQGQKEKGDPFLSSTVIVGNQDYGFHVPESCLHRVVLWAQKHPAVAFTSGRGDLTCGWGPEDLGKGTRSCLRQRWTQGSGEGNLLLPSPWLCSFVCSKVGRKRHLFAFTVVAGDQKSLFCGCWWLRATRICSIMQRLHEN